MDTVRKLNIAPIITTARPTAKPMLKVTTNAMLKVLTTDATAISSTLNKPFVASLIVCSALRPSPNP